MSDEQLYQYVFFSVHVVHYLQLDRWSSYYYCFDVDVIG